MMQPAIDRSSLERLVALGRQKGGLTNQDLAEALPVNDMSAEDIALVVVHLEESGIPVDLDESLMSPHGSVSPHLVQGAQIVSRPERSDHPQAKPVRAELSRGPDSNAARSATPGSRGMRPAHWAVLASLLILLLIGLFVVIR
jgi:hypothetical protein